MLRNIARCFQFLFWFVNCLLALLGYYVVFRDFVARNDLKGDGFLGVNWDKLWELVSDYLKVFIDLVVE